MTVLKIPFMPYVFRDGKFCTPVNRRELLLNGGGESVKQGAVQTQ